MSVRNAADALDTFPSNILDQSILGKYKYQDYLPDYKFADGTTSSFFDVKLVNEFAGKKTIINGKEFRIRVFQHEVKLPAGSVIAEVDSTAPVFKIFDQSKRVSIYGYVGHSDLGVHDLKHAIDMDNALTHKPLALYDTTNRYFPRSGKAGGKQATETIRDNLIPLGNGRYMLPLLEETLDSAGNVILYAVD